MYQQVYINTNHYLKGLARQTDGRYPRVLLIPVILPSRCITHAIQFSSIIHHRKIVHGGLCADNNSAIELQLGLGIPSSVALHRINRQANTKV